jgi:DNA primase
LGQRDDQPDPRPRFRERLMIPIHDGQQHIVGFGGRLLRDDADGKAPKYLNSPQTALFDKGRQLYGLSWAKGAIRKTERALVVEGYFDAIRLALAGVEEAVAPLGTALTEEQADLLARLTNTVFLLYDSDEAGRKATFKAGLALLGRGVAPRVVSFPDGEDPDTFVRAHGRPDSRRTSPRPSTCSTGRSCCSSARAGSPSCTRHGAPSTSCSRRCAPRATRSRATCTWRASPTCRASTARC